MTIPSELTAAFDAGCDLVTRFWTNWHVGTLCALVSMAMVFTVDARLVRRFMASGRSFRAWLMLAAHPACRVIGTVCMYYGPAWTLRTGLRLLKSLYCLGRDMFTFLVGFDRWHVVLFTTGVIVAVFLWQTVLALWHHFNKRRLASQRIK